MSAMLNATLACAVLLATAGTALAQEAAGDTAADVKAKAEQTLDNARETADAVSKSIDTNPQAQEVSAGILKPIYQLAEAFSFPAFHWLAFAAMVAGAVSFALQLTLGKLVVLSRMSFSLSEVLSDALGLVVSLIGLVLTTQAATENSDFTKSAAAVLSATAAGAVIGFVFYLWGQKQELLAAAGRKKVVVTKTVEPNK
jgi:hypothetical protein